MRRRLSGLWGAVAGLAVLAGAVLANVYLGRVQMVYENVTLAAESARVDTVVVTNHPDDRARLRPMQIVWGDFGNESGHRRERPVFLYGESHRERCSVSGGAGTVLVLRPGPANAGAVRGEVQHMHTLAGQFSGRDEKSGG